MPNPPPYLTDIIDSFEQYADQGNAALMAKYMKGHRLSGLSEREALKWMKNKSYPLNA